MAGAAHSPHARFVVIVQRVRVRWSAASRGAAQANSRRAIPDAFPLPSTPAGEIIVHDVFAGETNGYRPTQQFLVGSGQARDAWLSIELHDDTAVLDWLPDYAAFPTRSGRSRLFTLAPGQIARYRANFRFTGSCCSPQWYYEQWTIQAANAPARSDLFRHARYARDIDDRVHLYGGIQRRSTRPSPA